MSKTKNKNKDNSRTSSTVTSKQSTSQKESTKKLLNCDKCAYTYSTSWQIRCHMMSNHPVITLTCICPKCSKSYSSKGLLKKHATAKHFFNSTRRESRFKSKYVTFLITYVGTKSGNIFIMKQINPHIKIEHFNNCFFRQKIW